MGKIRKLAGLAGVVSVFSMFSVPAAEAQWMQIRVEHSNKCLDASATNDGANVHQWECHGRDNQKWRLDEKGRLVERLTGKCLDDNGAGNVHLWPCHDGSNQHWRQDEQGRLVNGRENKCLDVSGASKDNGGNVFNYACHDGANQRWSRISGAKFVRFDLVKCISPAGGISEGAKVAAGIVGGVTGGALAGAAGAAGTAATGGALVVIAAGATVGGATGGAAAGVAGLEQLDRVFSGRDELYIRVNGNKVFPGGDYHKIDSQETVTLGHVEALTGNVEIKLYEWDLTGDDDMGGVTILPDVAPGQYTAQVIHPGEGSMYEVTYTVFTQ